MFKYADGSEILIGDNVLLNNGKTPGIVDLVVNTPAEANDFKVAEIGVMVKAATARLVYLTQKGLKEDPLRFVSRGKRKPLFKQNS
jgi:hypothetical protein